MSLDYSTDDYWQMYKDRNAIATEESAAEYAMRRSFVVYEEFCALFSSESVLVCKFCKSKKINYTTVQMRSADEAATVLCECLSCGKRFRIN